MTRERSGRAGGAGRTELRVVVAVLTFRRPDDLAAVLPLLAEQVSALEPAGQILVVDNDPDGGARAAVERHGGVARYTHEAVPGIAAARNRALALATADGAQLLVFIDDDERPVGDWLHRLVRTYLDGHPAAVVGPVVSEFATEPEAWIRAGRFFDRRRLATGAEVTIAATNNLLLDVAQVGAMGLTFDERFGLSGGSDMLLTRQLTRAGGRMVWCAEAVVVDVVPPERLTRRWVLRRAFRSGNTWARTSVALADGPLRRTAVRAVVAGQGLIRMLGGGARVVLGCLGGSMAHRARGRRTLARGAGMVAGVLGAIYVEYRRDLPRKTVMVQ